MYTHTGGAPVEVGIDRMPPATPQTGWTLGTAACTSPQKQSPGCYLTTNKIFQNFPVLKLKVRQHRVSDIL